MSPTLDWATHGRDWPNRATSRFVMAAGMRWHVQQTGDGPQLLLIHGTGAATHSWRGLLPLLAQRFSIVAPDLPGHGFTELPQPAALSLTGMADALQELLRVLGKNPDLVAGHSAGAAILAQLCLTERIAPRALISLNGAFLPFRGNWGPVFAPLSRFFSATSLLPRLFARVAEKQSVIEKLLLDTGSSVEPVGVQLYGRLASNPGHVAGALGMMANWDLRPLLRELPRLKPKLFLVAASNDRTIPAAEATVVSARVPGATLISQAGLGHLAHEERPQDTADIVVNVARSTGLLPAA